MKHLILLSFVILSLSLLSGCGFTLRGSQALPEEITEVLVVAEYKFAPIQRALSERLPVYQLKPVILSNIELSQADKLGAVKLQLQPEKLERRLLSVFSTGQVAEYELIYSVNYRVTFDGLPPVNASMSVSREYQDDPDEVLAKSRELELVLSEMRLETADRIIRLLSSQYTQALIDKKT